MKDTLDVIVPPHVDTFTIRNNNWPTRASDQVQLGVWFGAGAVLGGSAGLCVVALIFSLAKWIAA